MESPGLVGACAVVLAGGVGRRFGGPRPKQLLSLAGRTVHEHSVGAFAQHPGIDSVLVVAPVEHREEIGQLAQGAAGEMVVRVLEGGRERSDSTRRALQELQRSGTSPAAKILVHDAARPLVSQRIISDALAALDDHDAAATLLDSSDTVVRVAEGEIVESLPGHALRRHQTPQAFRLGVLADAHRSAEADPSFVATDDCSVVMQYRPDVRIAVVDGDPENIKITESIDLAIAEAILNSHT